MNADALTLAVHFSANTFNRAVKKGVPACVACAIATTHRPIQRVDDGRAIQRVVNVRGVIPWPKRRK